VRGVGPEVAGPGLTNAVTTETAAARARPASALLMPARVALIPARAECRAKTRD
jgi:hypothetical protein